MFFPQAAEPLEEDALHREDNNGKECYVFMFGFSSNSRATFIFFVCRVVNKLATYFVFVTNFCNLL